MKLPHLVITAAALLVSAAPPEKGPAHETPLEGTWGLCSTQIDMHPGRVITLEGDDMATMCRLVITKDRYTVNLGDGTLKMVYRLYPRAKPSAIDLILTEGADKGKCFHGIYKLEGDTLTICRSSELEKERPKSFTVEPGSSLMMTVWKRTKT
jgi:uncharacterized protein (TIGR03067 family)